MSNTILHLSSIMPTAFCINGEQIGCVDNPCEYLSVSVSSEDFILYINPLEQINKYSCSLSYYVKISCRTPKPIAYNDLITITDYGHNHFVICAKPLLVPRLIEHKHCTDIYEDCRASYIGNNIYLTNNTNAFSFVSTEPLVNLKLSKNAPYINLLAKTVSNKDYLMLFNSKLRLLFDCTADKIEIVDNHIISLTNVNDIARHGLVKDYEIKDGIVALSKSYTVYTQNTPTTPANLYAIPYAFLEAIAIKNFSLARTYLHPNLAQVLSDEAISQFFGNFVEATPTIEEPKDVLALVYEGNPRFVKKFHFDLSDNRIINIDTFE